MFIRRIILPFNIKKPILACGADLKGAFAFARGNEAFLADGFGDLSDLDNFTKYEKAIKIYQKKLGITPKIVACDLHPDYFSTRFKGNPQVAGGKWIFSCYYSYPPVPDRHGGQPFPDFSEIEFAGKKV